MKIGYDAKRFLFNKTGLGNYSRSLINSLLQYSTELELHLFSGRKTDYTNPNPNLHLHVNTSATKLYRSFGIVNDAKKQQIDIYHGLSNEIPFGLTKAKIKSVVTIHDVIFRQYPEFYGQIDRQIYHFKTQHAIQNADLIIATSESTKKNILQYYKCEESLIEVVYQPISSEFLTPSNNMKETSEFGDYFLYTATFNKRKNHAALIMAFKAIEKQTHFNLVLAGSNGDTSKEIHSLIESQNLQNRVFIEQNIPQNKMHSLLQNAKAFVYPSLIEGFGIPLAEAANFGLPMALSNIDVFKELAGNDAVYFHPNKPNEMADAMLQIAAKPKTSYETILQKIDPKKIGNQIENLYKNL